MNLHERIKFRREELLMTQTELAMKLGYKSRSSINKIEQGLSDIPQSKIKAFAEALDTSVGALMGWGNELGDLIRSNRLAKGQVLREYALSIGLDYKRLDALERGYDYRDDGPTAPLTPSEAEKISKAVGVPADSVCSLRICKPSGRDFSDECRFIEIVCLLERYNLYVDVQRGVPGVGVIIATKEGVVLEETVMDDFMNHYSEIIENHLTASKSQIRKKTMGVRIPVLNRVSAGVPIEAIENIVCYEEIPEEMAKTGDFFGLIIKGESMEPKMSDGDVVIIRRQGDIESGQVGVVIVDDTDATVIRVIKESNGIMLVATNQTAYPPKFFDSKQVEDLPVVIIGKVAELRAKF